MKARILSMQRVVNYGSFMQAYALKRVVESLGYEVAFSDFRPGTPRHKGEKVRRPGLLDKAAKLPRIVASPKRFLDKRAFRRALRQTFVTKAWPALGIGPDPDYETGCDVMIIGSDEVFNYTQNHTFGYVPAFFGYGLAANSIIAYAASAGYANIDDVETDGMADTIADGFAKFDRIGVRDQSTFDMVAKYASRRPDLVVDPTLLYDFDQELHPVSRKDGFVLVYAYEGRLDAPSDVASVRRFAASRGLRTVSVGFFHQWCDENLVVEPFELLSLFARASCVVTDTFHGTIFSIKNRKPFVSLLRHQDRCGSNANKLGFLLAQLGLDSRINRDLDQLGSDLDRPIDYEQVGQALMALRQDSLAFLAEALAARHQTSPAQDLVDSSVSDPSAHHASVGTLS